MFEDNKHFDTLAFYLVWLADGRCFCNGRMANQARFDFHRTQAVTTDFDHIIHATLNAGITVTVHRRSITGEVHLLDGVPIGLVTSWIAKDRAHLSRPRLAYDQKSTFALANAVAVLVYYIGLDRRQRATCAAGLEWQNRRWPDHDGPGLCLPRGIHNRQFAAPDVLVIPYPGFRVDRLADRTEQAQACQVVPGRQFFAKAHQAANRGRGRVEDRHLVLVYNTPPPVSVRVGRNALEQYTGRGVHQWAVNAIAMAGHPTHIGGTPEHVARFDIKHKPGGGIGSHCIATLDVYHPLWLARAAAGIQYEEHIPAVHRLAGDDGISGNIFQQVVQVHIAPLLHREVFPGPPNDDHLFHRGRLRDCLIRYLLEFDGSAATIAAIGGGEHFCLTFLFGGQPRRWPKSTQNKGIEYSPPRDRPHIRPE